MRCVILLLSVAVVSAFTAIYGDVEHTDVEWEAYKLTHRKKYQTEKEERDRLAIYAKNQIMVAQHNERHSQGLTSFTMTLNEFSDWFPSELQRLKGYKRPAVVTDKTGEYQCSGTEELPTAINWVEKQAVTPVKHQGQCGSCWAFSATGALEGQYFLKTGKLVSLSEQNLIDCCTNNGNDGCKGGFSENAFIYVAENGGIDSEEKYPYQEQQYECSGWKHMDEKGKGQGTVATYGGGLYQYNAEYSTVTVQGVVKLPKEDEDCLKEALAKNGPISIAVDSNPCSFIYYHKGVYYDDNCTTITNHAMLLVGYGTDEEEGDYWLIKNSWGEGWGIDGYMMLARNRDNHCGIASDVSFPIV